MFSVGLFSNPWTGANLAWNALDSSKCCLNLFYFSTKIYIIIGNNGLEFLFLHSALFIKDGQALLFCIAIQYQGPGIGIAILMLKMSNTWAIPEDIVQAKRVHCSCGSDIAFLVWCLTSPRAVYRPRWIKYSNIFKRRKKIS